MWDFYTDGTPTEQAIIVLTTAGIAIGIGLAIWSNSRANTRHNVEEKRHYLDLRADQEGEAREVVAGARLRAINNSFSVEVSVHSPRRIDDVIFEAQLGFDFSDTPGGPPTAEWTFTDGRDSVVPPNEGKVVLIRGYVNDTGELPFYWEVTWRDRWGEHWKWSQESGAQMYLERD